jgi:hypothetical protein
MVLDGRLRHPREDAALRRAPGGQTQELRTRVLVLGEAAQPQDRASLRLGSPLIWDVRSGVFVGVITTLLCDSIKCVTIRGFRLSYR